MGRKIRVEFKRKNSNASTNLSPQKLEKEKLERTPEKQQNALNLDLENLDEDSKKFYEQLIAFKENPTMMELAFPHTLTSYQKKQIHFLADKLGLTHFSHENDTKNGNQRHTLVIKKSPLSDDMNSTPKRRNSRAKTWSTEKNKDSDYDNYSESSKGSHSQTMKSSPKLSPSFPSGSPPVRGHLKNALMIQPVRQPRGPDGTRGFTAGRGKLIQSVS